MSVHVAILAEVRWMRGGQWGKLELVGRTGRFSCWFETDGETAIPFYLSIAAVRNVLKLVDRFSFDTVEARSHIRTVKMHA